MDYVFLRTGDDVLTRRAYADPAPGGHLGRPYLALTGARVRARDWTEPAPTSLAGGSAGVVGYVLGGAKRRPSRLRARRVGPRGARAPSAASARAGSGTRRSYPDPSPPSTPADVAAGHPAHRTSTSSVGQGAGHGRRCSRRCSPRGAAGSPGVHLGSLRPIACRRFYRRLGFEVLCEGPGVRWMGQRARRAEASAHGA